MYGYYLNTNKKKYILYFETLEDAKKQHEKDAKSFDVSPIYKSYLKMN